MLEDLSQTWGNKNMSKESNVPAPCRNYKQLISQGAFTRSQLAEADQSDFKTSLLTSSMSSQSSAKCVMSL